MLAARPGTGEEASRRKSGVASTTPYDLRMTYPPPGYPQQPYFRPPDHPQATTIIILGVLGLVLCQFLGPVAFVMGGKALKEIDNSGGAIGGRSTVQAGYICGIIGTVILVLTVLVLVAALVVALVAGSSTSSTY